MVVVCFCFLIKKAAHIGVSIIFVRLQKKRTTIGLGVYPNLSLADARKYREEYKELLAQDIDPFAHRKEQEEHARFAMRNTFEAVAREFMQTEKLADSTRHRNEFIYQYLFDAIGKKPIHEITARQLLDVCQIYDKQGKSETARRMRSKAGQVFKYGLVLGLCDRNIALDIQGLLQPHIKSHHAAVTDPNLLSELLVAIDNYTNRGSIVMSYALKILPHVFVRPGELRHAMWADFNLDEKTWAYTPSKTKNALGTQLIVPLSDQVLAMFKELQMITGGSEYCFANYWGKTTLLSDSSINKALKNLGWENGETTGHGFRATARTLLDEVLKFPIERIEQQLGHQVRDMHGRAYNRTKYLEERQAMMQAWSDYLDQLTHENEE
jgi:integrase